MNHIYKSIFNKALGVFTAVPEFASAHGKGSERTVVGRVAKGTAGFAASALAISVGLALTSTSAVASAGIYVNDGTDPGCLALPDTPYPNTGIYGISSSGNSIVPGNSMINPGYTLVPNSYFGLDQMKPCLPSGDGVHAAATQTNRTLFYGNTHTVDTTNNGSKNLTLGGRLDVNSGIIGVGDRGVNGAGATNSIRMGTGTTLDEANKHTNAIAIGVDTATTAEGAVAISAEAKARTSYSIAIGRNATAGGDMVPPSNETGGAIAIGRNSLSNYIGAIALGNGAEVSSAKPDGKTTDGIAIGTKALVGNYRGMAIGAQSQAKGSQSIVLANNAPDAKVSVASGIRSQVYGVESEASGTDAVAIGYKNTVAAHRTYAIGNEINVAKEAEEALAFGTRAHVSGAYQISLGSDAGADAVAANTSGIAIGRNAGRYGQSGILNTAIGAASGQYVSGSYNIAMGTGAGSGTDAEKLAASQTISIGHNAKASKRTAIAMGTTAAATGIGSIALGKSASATDQRAIAMGENALAGNEASMALGYNSSAKGSKQVSIGLGAGALKNATDAGAELATFVGHYAGADNASLTGNAQGVAVGVNAGRFGVAGIRNVAVGSNTGQTVNGNDNTSIGYNSGRSVEGSGNLSGGLNSGVFLKGNNNVALGSNAGNGTAAQALEVNSTTSIGNDAKALTNDSVAIGTGAKSGKVDRFSGERSVAIGAKAEALGTGGIAIGDNAATTDGHNSVAIGVYSKTQNEKAISIGAFNKATGAQSIVIAGNYDTKNSDGVSTATAARATVIGAETNVSGEQSVAIGDKNNVVSARTYAMGNNITTGAGAHDSLAFGTQAYVGNASAIAMGNAAKAVGKEQVSIGKNAGADSANSEGNYYGVYIGSEAGRYQQGAGRNYAIGQNAGQYVKGSSNIALGTDAGKGDAGNVIDASSTIAIGRETKAAGYSGIAIGTQAEATHANGIALGDNASATNGHDSLAVGAFSKTTAAKAMSIGSYSTASGAQSIVIANNYADASGASNRSTATAARAIVMGPESHATAEDALAIGNKNTVASARTYAIGNNINVAAGADDSLAFGSSAAVGAANTVAIGANANAAQANSVALGAGSATDAPHTGDYTLNNSYAAAGVPNAANGTVSVGAAGKERQIQNVAAGVISATSTDAINGSQLYATNNYMNNFAGDVKTKLGGNAALGNDGHLTMTNIGGTGENTVDDAIKNLKTAIDNKADTTASVTSENQADIKVDKEAPVGNTTNYKLSLGNDAKAKLAKAATALQTVEGDSNITATKDATDPTKVKLALNRDLTADSVTLGDTTTAEHVVLNKDGLTVGNLGPALSNSGIDMRGGQIGNLVGGPVKYGERTAVSAGMLYDVAKTVQQAIGGETELDSDDPNKSLPSGRLTLSNVGETGESTIHDAIKSVNDKAKTAVQEIESANPTALSVKKDGTKVTLTPNFITGDLVNADGTVNAPAAADEGKLVSAKTVADALKANHFVVDTKGNTETGSEADAKVGSGNKVTFEAGKNLTAKQANTANGGATVKFSLQDDISLNSVTAGTGDNQVVLNDAGVNVGNKNYINKDGLNANGNKVANVKAGDVSATSTDAVNGAQLHNVATSVANVLGGNAAVDGNGNVTSSDIGGTGANTVDDAIKAVNATAAKHTTVVEGKNVKVTKGKNAAGGDEYTVATKDDLDVTSVTAGNTTVNTNGLTITGGPSVTRGGIDAGNRIISGVKAGDVSANSQEAVNGSQLHATNTKLDGVKAKADTAVQDVKSGDENALAAVKDPNTNIVTVTPKLSGDLVDADGNITAPATPADKGKLVTAGTVAQALANTHFVVDTKATDGELDSASQADQKIKAGNKVTLQAGKNLKAKQTNAADGATVEFSLKDSISLTQVTAGTGDNQVVLGNNGVQVGGKTYINNDGLNANNKTITNVAPGAVTSTSNDAVNGSQLYNVADNVKDLIGPDAKIDPATGKVTVADPTKGIGETGKGTIGEAIKSVKDKADTAVQDIKSGDEKALSVTKAGNTYTITPNLSGDLVDANGNITAPATDADKGKLVTAGTVAQALANTHFVVDTKATDGELDGASQADQKIKAGNKVTLQAGKNLKAKQTNGTDGAQVEFSLKDSISLTQVTAGTGDNQVVLGNDGVKVGGNTYINKDGLNANSKVISNVADGVAPTDAVNKGQLDAVKGVADSAVQSVDVAANENNLVVDNNDPKNPKLRLRKAVDLDSIKLENNVGEKSFLNSAGLTIKDGPAVTRSGINANNTKVTNVTDGDVNGTSKDAVNGSQLYNVASNVKDLIGPDAAIDPATGKVTVADPTKGIGETGKGTIGEAIKAVKDAADKAAAEHTTVKAGNNIVVTEGTNAAGGKEYTVKTADNLDVTSVKAGDTTVNNDGLTIAGGPSVKKDGINAGDKNITNVADGNVAAGSKDAVNGGQLYDVAKNVADLVGPDATIDPATGKVTVADPTKGIGETGKGTIGDAIKAVNDLAKKAAAEKTSVKAKDGRSNVTVTEGTNAAGGHEYTVDVERVVTEAGSDQVTVTSKHDADSNTTTYTVDVSDKTKASLAKADSAVQGLTSKDGNLNFNKGPNGNVEVSFNDNLNVKNITTDGVKAGDTTINSNGIEIVNGPSMTKDGINAAGKAISNVANGNVAKGSKDAVNGGQLHETAQSVADVIGGGATVKDGKVVAGQNGIGNTGQNTVHGAIAAINQNTANNFNQIRGDLRKMDRDLRGGIAGALATAGLPQAFRPGKSMVAAAASTYRGQSGLAIGVSRISDNGKVILKVTGNTNSRGDFGGTIGAGYQW